MPVPPKPMIIFEATVYPQPSHVKVPSSSSAPKVLPTPSKARELVIAKKLPQSKKVLQSTSIPSSSEVAAIAKKERARIRHERNRALEAIKKRPARPSRPTDTTQLPYAPVAPLPAVRKHAPRSNLLPIEAVTRAPPQVATHARKPVRPRPPPPTSMASGGRR